MGLVLRRRTAEHPEIEDQLFHEFKEMRQVGKPVKRYWFVRRAKQILNEKNPDHEFRFSSHWSEQFQNRYNISLRNKTHCSQKAPSDLEQSLKSFIHTSLNCNLVVIIKTVILRTWIRYLCPSY